MNIRWLRANGTLLALLAVAMVTVGLLATLVVRQQHDQPTETGQVSLEKSGGTAPPVPSIPADPPPSATDDRGVEAVPAPQPVGTGSEPAPAVEPATPATPAYSNVTPSHGSAHPEAAIPSGSSGHSDPPARRADEPVHVEPPRDAREPDHSDQPPPLRRPSPPHPPAQPSKPVEPSKPAQPRKPTEPDKSEQGKPGKSPDGKPGKSPDGKPGKAAEQGKPGKSADGKPGKPAGEGKPGKSGDPGKPGKPDNSTDASKSDGSDVRTQQTVKSRAPGSAGTRETTSDPDALTQSEPVVKSPAQTDEG